MSLSQTPDAADINAVTGQEVAATDELSRADIKKKVGMSPGAHAALWIVIGFFAAMLIIAAWPVAMLLIHGANNPLTGPSY